MSCRLRSIAISLIALLLSLWATPALDAFGKNVNWQDPPGALKLGQVPKGSYVRIAPEFDAATISVPGAAAQIVITARDEWRGIRCIKSLDDSILYERPFRPGEWLRISEPRYDRFYVSNAPEALRAGNGGEYERFDCLDLYVYAEEDEQGNRAWNSRKYVEFLARRLRCVFELKILLPEGESNPALTCDLDPATLERTIEFKP